MTHAIGDRAITSTLDAYEAAGVTEADRARIEHCELPGEKHLDRMAATGVICSMQPNFIQWSGPGRLYERRLGAARDASIDPHRRVIDAGVRLAFGSDHMPLGPVAGIHRAVNAPHDAQRIGVAEALRAYTAGGAYAGFAEADRGTIEAGGVADLIVLSGNPFRCERSIDSLTVQRTYVGGRLVYKK